MEIKRVGDQFIVDIQQKRFRIYWNRKYEFGENLIRRFFERIRLSELEKLDNVVRILNNAYVNKKTSLTEGEYMCCEEVNRIIKRIVVLQCTAYFASVDLEDLKNFIEACRAFGYEYGTTELKRLYAKRFDGLETPTERKCQECSCLEDWAVTRSLVARFVATDIVAAYRYIFLDDSKKVVQSLMSKTNQLKLGSFFIQMFMETPALSGLDKKGIMTDIIQQCYKEISTRFKKRHSLSKQINEGESEYRENWDKIRTLHTYIKDTYEPKRSIIEPRKEYCKWSDEYRRQIVVDFFKKWDANMVDDIAYLKKQQELSEQSEKEKQAAIDKSDIEYTGKTQAQWKEEQHGLEMELKDESGNVVHTEKIQ